MTPSHKRTSLVGTTRHLDGGACLNQRSILAACDLFLPAEATSEPIRLSELLEALWFLELTIVSKGVTFDGTLPDRDVKNVLARVGELSDRAGYRDGFFRGVMPGSFQEQSAFMSASAGKALDDIRGMSTGEPGAPFGPQPGLDRPFPEDTAQAFFGELQTLASDIGRQGEGGLDDDRLDHLANRSGQRGGKCIAGIAALGPAGLEQAIRLPDELDIAPGLAMSTLMNRFRFSYVRQLAFGARDVYVPAARWKPLSEFHAFTFAEVVRRHFEQRFTGGLGAEMREALETELGGADGAFTVALPPLGLYVLMSAPPAASPSDVVRSALEEFEGYGRLFRHFWSTTREVDPPEGGWAVTIGDAPMDGVHDRVEQVLTDRLGSLVARAKRRNASVLERFLTSTVRFAEIGTAGVGEILGQAFELPVPGMGAMAGAAAGSFLSIVGQRAKVAVTGHVDDYRTLEQTLAGSLADLRMGRLADQVERVFGRKLVW